MTAVRDGDWVFLYAGDEVIYRRLTRDRAFEFVNLAVDWYYTGDLWYRHIELSLNGKNTMWYGSNAEKFSIPIKDKSKD